MSSCLPTSNKCEWVKLQPLVVEYNKIYGTDFKLIKCLDIKERQRPQPEIRLKDEVTEDYMVIEHKSIVWPRDKAKKHKVFHEVSECVITEVEAMFCGKPYVLRFFSKVELDRKTRDALIGEIVLALTTNMSRIESGGALGSRKFIPWKFCIDKEYDHEGICVEEIDLNCEDPTLIEIEKMKKEILDFTQNAFYRSIAKFFDYTTDIKVVALSYYCDEYIEFDELFKCLLIPDCVDQVWVEKENWLNEMESTITYRCVYKKQKIL